MNKYTDIIWRHLVKMPKFRKSLRLLSSKSEEFAKLEQVPLQGVDYVEEFLRQEVSTIVEMIPEDSVVSAIMTTVVEQDVDWRQVALALLSEHENN